MAETMTDNELEELANKEPVIETKNLVELCCNIPPCQENQHIPVEGRLKKLQISIESRELFEEHIHKVGLNIWQFSSEPQDQGKSLNFITTDELMFCR